MDSARYHPGEVQAHRLAGLVDQAEHSRLAIRGTFPAAATDFLKAQPMLVLSAADAEEHVWAALVSARPGFVSVAGERTLDVHARPAPGDPLAAVLAKPARVGAIAIEPGTRRRMRVNGSSRPTGTGLRITADQVYANCPKYIAQRSPWQVDDQGSLAGPRVATALDAQQQRLIAAADTFFVGTRSADGDLDASHRGGNPGFVRVHDATSLSWPDYTGNAMLMTLGNLLQDPAAGLLFVDWDSGSTLQLSGTARTDWAPGTSAPPGAHRVVHVDIDRVVQQDGVSALRWTPPALSRSNPPLSAPAGIA